MSTKAMRRTPRPLILILAILWLPDGIVPAVKTWLKRRRPVEAKPHAAVVPVVPAAPPSSARRLTAWPRVRDSDRAESTWRNGARFVMLDLQC